MVEHLTFNQVVLGSSPSALTKNQALLVFLSGNTFYPEYFPANPIGKRMATTGWCDLL
jgi:hypothetical protein